MRRDAGHAEVSSEALEAYQRMRADSWVEEMVRKLQAAVLLSESVGPKAKPVLVGVERHIAGTPSDYRIPTPNMPNSLRPHAHAVVSIGPNLGVPMRNDLRHLWHIGQSIPSY